MSVSNTGSLIVVPLDGSPLAEQAIPYAQALAGEGGRLLFLQVTPDAEPVYGLLGNIVASEGEVKTIFAEAAQDELQSTATRWQELAPRVEIEIVAGDPAEQILRVADERQAALIVIASHGRGAIGRWTFGSVADRLARTATVPVMIIRPRDTDAEIALPLIRRLVVPHDGSALADEALPVAAELARATGARVHLIQAINPSSALAPYPGLEAAYSAELYGSIEQDLINEAQRTLGEAARTLSEQGIEATTAVAAGPPVAVIEDSLEEGDLIIMTSHGRSGVRRWVLGSVAEKLIRTGAAPVVLVPSSTRSEAAGAAGR